MGNYFYLNEKNEQKGPVAPEELINNGVTPNTLVWKKGMPLWVPAKTVEELKSFFQENVPPPPPQFSPTPKTKPENWLVLAILSTLFCFFPFGIVSIVYATKVDRLWNAGLYEESKKASKKARLFLLLSAGGWVIIGIIIALIALIVTFFDNSEIY
ncbi:MULTISPECIES: CD225/dispanin family protein [Butyricimonas]|uniref:CD225/dispanin family protein n=1 Tax=Butyricimonas TaxID=574697 RepID=UPI0007FB1F7B|nr:MULTISPECIES: CD225/dispanin family protein [Butyricimonas]